MLGGARGEEEVEGRAGCEEECGADGDIVDAGRADLTLMARASCWGRLAMATGFSVLVFLDLAPVLLLGIAGNELLGVLWTTRALTADARAGTRA